MTAIIAQDMEFYEKLPKLFPFADARFIIAARSIGLDCGPMSGFDNAKVDAAFFEGQPGNQISSAISVMEIRANYAPERRVLNLMRHAKSSDFNDWRSG